MKWRATLCTLGAVLLCTSLVASAEPPEHSTAAVKPAVEQPIMVTAPPREAPPREAPAPLDKPKKGTIPGKVWPVSPSLTNVAGSGGLRDRATILVRIFTDNYPGETTWDVRDSSANVICSGGPYSQQQTLHEETCTVDPAGCYSFTIYDSYGDGICCAYGDGWYEVYYEGSFICSGDVFGYSETCGNIGGGCGGQEHFVVTAPYSGPWRNTCGAADDCTMHTGPDHTYQVTVPSDGMWTFSLCGSTYDTYMYVGTTLCGQEVGYNDDWCGLQSQLTATITAGTYYVDVEGYAGYCGDYVLNIWKEVDFNVTAPYISPTRNTCGEGDDCTMDSGDDHTYRVTIPNDGTWTFSLCGSAYDTYMYVGTTVCGQEVGYNDDWCGLQSQLTADITAGTYYVDVEGFGTACGDYVLSIFDSDFAVAAPVADETGNTCGAGNDCALLDSEEVTYLVHIPDAGDWTFSLCGSDFDTYLFVGTTLCGQEVGYNDDYCGVQSQLTATINAGYYYVAIEAFSSTDCGNYVLNIWQEGGQPPPNDDCEDAQVINSPYPVTVPGTNINATIDCPGLLDWEGVWYDVELPYASNDLTVTICPTDHDISTAGIVVMDDCACDDYITSSDEWFMDCPNGYQGIEIEFWQLPGPGRIYFPLYVAPPADFEVTFNVTWHPPCDLDCPPGGIPEGEPVCYDGYVDNYNGGCNSTPFVFQPIACGDVICGTSGVYDFEGLSYRDTDWFEILTNTEMTFTWSAIAEFPVLIFIIDGGSGDCIDYSILDSATAPECELASLTIGPVPPGRYWFWVGPSDWGPYPCGVEYIAELTCLGGPPNDDCENAMPIGDVTDLPFDTTDATFDGPGECQYAPNVWYCYTATCTGVMTVDTCGSQYDTMIAVYDGCTCDPIGPMLCCNDDHCCDGDFMLQSRCMVWVEQGRQYLIEVGGYSSNTGAGDLTVRCDPADYFFDTVWQQGSGNGWPYPEAPGQWIYYPSGWWNQWWPNEFDLYRPKLVRVEFDVEFPCDYGWLEFVINWTTPDWVDPYEPPFDDEFINRAPDPPINITQPGHYEFEIILPYCPRWVSVDVRGEYTLVRGTIYHECLPGPDFVVTAPYEGPTRNTCGAGDDCTFHYGEDHTYQVNIPNDGTWTFSLCGSEYDTYMYVGTTLCGQEVGYNDDSCGLQSQLTADITAGTYFVDVEGFGGACGNYVLRIWEEPECDVECPPGGIDEGEPVCYDGYVDNYNGGCNSTPFVFQPIACGDVICGTSGVYDFSGLSYRDTDWFEILTNTQMTFTWSAVAEFPVLIFIIDGGSGNCLDYAILGNTTAPACELASLTIGPVPAGRYWFWVGPEDWGNYPCGVEYVAELTCVGEELGACCFPDGHCEELSQGECEKMHYPQLPDPSGWDVMATHPLILADDFLCTWSGPLTIVRFWGSWQGDQVGQLQIVRLSIHEDIPAEQSPTGYSMPGELLWSFEEWPGPPGVEPVSWQGWYDPAGPVVLQNDHQLWFQYDMVIPEEIAFFQEAGTIYWLNIQAITEGGIWGWKTSLDHWNDNAVWGIGEDPDLIEWQELTDPVTGGPLDLAFMGPGQFQGVGTDCDPNPCPPVCPGDIDGDGDTDLNDLALLLSAYGSRPGDPNWNPACDLDGDGDVDLTDLAILLSDYGCPP